MSRLFALLTIAAFALSGPLNARTLLATGETDEALVVAGVPADVAPPECTKGATEVAVTTEGTGGMLDAEAASAEAQSQTCCWVFAMGRWWCVLC